MTQATLILVAGVHRSGTSATTRFIAELGADMPNDLMPAVEGNNAYGFWESEHVVAFNDRVFSALGMNWHSPGPMPDNWVDDERVQPLIGELDALLDQLSNPDMPVVVKDPRFSRLLPLWSRRAKDKGIDLRIILPFRHPLEVYRSLNARDGFDQAKSMMLWLRYNLEAERSSRTLPRAFVAFDQLLEQPEVVRQNIGAQLELEWRRSWAQAKPFLDDFLDPALRHESASPDELSGLPSLVRSLYQILLDQPENQAAWDALWPSMSINDELHGTLLNEQNTMIGLLRRKVDRLKADAKIDPETGSTSRAAPPEEDLDRLRVFLASNLQAPLTAVDSLGRELRRTIRDSSDRMLMALSQRETLLADLASAEQEINGLNLQVDERAREFVLLQRQLLKSEARLSRIRRRNDFLERSMSWRVTAPFRALPQLFRRLTASERQVRKEAAVIRASDWFDADWYLKVNPDVGYPCVDAAEHYCRIGWMEGRDPGPRFSTEAYLARYPDVRDAKANPLLHFLLHGRLEGRLAG